MILAYKVTLRLNFSICVDITSARLKADVWKRSVQAVPAGDSLS